MDLSAVKEGTWHGASLAIAEMARRGVLGKDRLAELVPWLLKVCSIFPFLPVASFSRDHELIFSHALILCRLFLRNPTYSGYDLRSSDFLPLDWNLRSRRVVLRSLVSRPSVHEGRYGSLCSLSVSTRRRLGCCRSGS